MARLIVHHFEDDLESRLKCRARRHGHSIEEEVQHILRNALMDENRPASKLGSRITARFAQVGLTVDLPELHGQQLRPDDVGGISP